MDYKIDKIFMESKGLEILYAVYSQGEILYAVYRQCEILYAIYSQCEIQYIASVKYCMQAG